MKQILDIVHLAGFAIEIYKDARSYESQIWNFAFIDICLCTVHAFFGRSLLLLFTCAYVTSTYPHLTNPFPLPTSIPLSLFRDHNLSFQTASLSTMTGSRLSHWPPNLEVNSTVFITPGAV